MQNVDDLLQEAIDAMTATKDSDDVLDGPTYTPKGAILNKAEFVNMLRVRGYSKRDAEVVIEDVFSTISEILIAGRGVNIQGFGSFRLCVAKPRKVRNPKTNETWISEPSARPKFKAGKNLVDAVRKGYLMRKENAIGE